MTRGTVGGVSRKCVVQDARELRAALLKKIPLQEREHLLQSELASKAITSDDVDFGMDFDTVLPPPGEEAHAGEEMLLYQELDQLTNDHRKCSDLQDQSQRIHDEVHSWLEQYNALSEALQAYLHDHLQPPIYDSNELETFSIEVVDIFAREVYYHRYLATQYHITYDVYLEVLRRIDMKIDTHLGHDTPHWQMLNSCPAYQYQLKDEPALKFSVLCTCDGNNSAKLVDPVICRGNERLDP
ncbi:hypothetical protein BDR03DRAFT_1009178 [Suillus americanus]|nr:hypothetical protein BDR03DRAFT_1009178 [Suillus americanus]